MRLALALAFALVSSLLVPGSRARLCAQTTVSTRHASVTFGGKLLLNTIYRNDRFYEATKGEGGNTPGDPATGTTTVIEPGLQNTERLGNTISEGSDELYLDPNVSLRFDVDVGESITGVVELRTPFSNLDAGGKDGSPFSGFSDRTLELKQLYVQASDVFWEGFSIRAGIQDFRKDLRGDGHAFVIDSAGSENPFDGAALVTVGMTDFNGGGRIRTSTGFADTVELAGGLLTQTFGQSSDNPAGLVRFDGWAYTFDERYRSGGDTGPSEKYFWGLSADVYLGQDGQYGKLQAMVFDLMNGGSSHLFTAGGGFDVYPVGRGHTLQWEVFAEAYGQSGEYHDDHFTLGSGSDLDQRDAFAVQAGTKLSFPIEIAEGRELFPFAEVSFVEVSGDSNYTDTKNQNFVSLENNNRTLIVENGYYGFDIDTNYRGARVAAGADYGPFSFELLYAYLEWQDNSGGRASGGTTDSRKIGDEIDLTVTYSHSSALELGLKLGWLLDPAGLGLNKDVQMTLFEIALSF